MNKFSSQFWKYVPEENVLILNNDSIGVKSDDVGKLSRLNEI